MKMNSRLKKFSTKVEFFRLRINKLLLPLVLLILVLSLVYVGVGNHALFYNTKFYEEFEYLYKVPKFYSLSDMKVEIDSTYYSIKEVVYVFRSAGTKFDISSGVLTQGYRLGMYFQPILAAFVSLLYLVSELVRLLSSVEGVVLSLKSRKWWSRGYILAWVLLLFLVVQVLFPLL